MEVHLIIGGTGMLCGGSFAARNKSEISMVAYQYIENIKRETGYRTTFIQKVIVDGTQDITEELREIDNRPIPDMDDIFWLCLKKVNLKIHNKADKILATGPYHFVNTRV